MPCPPEECDGLRAELNAVTLAVEALQLAIQALDLARSGMAEELTSLQTTKAALEGAIDECECPPALAAIELDRPKVSGTAKVFARGMLNVAFGKLK